MGSSCCFIGSLLLTVTIFSPAFSSAPPPVVYPAAMRCILPFALGWGGVPRPPSRSGGTSPPPCWGPTTPPPPPGLGTPNIPFYPWGEVPLRISSYHPPPRSPLTPGEALDPPPLAGWGVHWRTSLCVIPLRGGG